jgi:hypothetical protein
VGLIGHLVVALPRRLAALLIALIATVSLAGTAYGSPKDVINDFLDDGAIGVCHTRADYDAARREGVVSAYGDLGDAIDTALENPDLVGTAEKSCAATAAASDGGSGVGTALLIGIPVGLCAIAVAMLYRGRRRAGVDGDEHGESPS